MKRFASVCCATMIAAGLFGAINVPEWKQLQVSRLDIEKLEALIGGICANSGCSGTTNCTANNGPNGANCGSIPTTCLPYNGTCQMVQLVNGAACGQMAGYQNCKVATLTTMCGNIVSGTMNDQGQCPTCATPTNTTCGTLQVQCTMDG